MTMSVGIFTDCYLPTKNGVVTSVVQLKEGLERSGHRAVVVTVDSPGCEVKDKTVYRFPSIPFNPEIEIRLGLVNQRSINSIVRREHIDIIHTHTEFSIGWAAKRAARSFGLPLVHTTHTMYEQYRHYLFFGRLLPARMIRRWLKLFLSNYDALVCPSVKVQDYLKSFMPHIRTVVIGNGVCKTRFRPTLLTREERAETRQALGIQPSDKVIIYVGRMAKEKRVLELFNVLTPLLKRYPHYKALFVGRGPSYRHMIEEAKRHNLREQIVFTGYLNWGQMHKMYSISDVFVTASMSEVHPVTLIEASMCGLPIVARRDSSYVDLIQDGYNGYLVDSDRQIAERLSEILSDETKLLQFSENSVIVSDRFNAETHVEKIESLYQQILANSVVSL
jgi:1,2-diacylglycerol 3-alpha-glucosyltransferase